MNEHKAFLILMAILVIVPMAGLVIQQLGETSIKIEAIKAGLIQKVDPETKEPIWTKP